MHSSSLAIDAVIFVVFLLANIVVGFRYRGKSNSFREYAVGNKKFSTATLTATIVATWTGGNIFFNALERTYVTGLYYIIPSVIGDFACLSITGYVIGPRMGKFLGNVSVPDSLGKLYGKHVQAIAGISTVLGSVGYIAIQFKVIHRILSIYLTTDSVHNAAGIVFNEEWIAIIVASIVIFYATSGGAKAVTFTDVIQFLTFGTLLPVLALVVWNSLKDPKQVTQLLIYNPNFSFQKVFRWSPELKESIVWMIYVMTPGLAPELFQRMAMARDVTQMKRSIGYAAIVCQGVKLCIMWIAILLLADQTGLESSKLVQYMVNTYTYPGLRGFLCIGVIAMAISTADSLLNACAVVIANDIFPPLRIQKVSSLNTAKWATVFLGCLAVIVALRVENFLNILLGSANFYTPIVVIPMLLAVFGFETSRRVVLMAMGAGVATAAAYLLYFQSVSSFFPGMLVNFSVMMGAHYLLGEQGGWGHNPLPKSTYETSQRYGWKDWVETVQNFKLYPYLQQNLPKQESFFSLFGLYTMAVIYAAFYTTDKVEHTAYQVINAGIYHTVLPITTAFLTFPIWPPIIKNHRFMAFFWPLGIGAILFFAGTLLVIMSGFHHMQVMVMMINLLMAVLLLRWPLALFVALTGIALAVSFFTHYTGTPLPLSAFGSMQMIYLSLLFACLLIVLKGKQVYRGLVTSYAQLREENSFASQVLLATLRCCARLHQDARSYSVEALDSIEQLSDQMHALNHAPTRAQLMAGNAALQQHVYMLDTLTKHLHQVLHLAQEPMHLVVETVALPALWQDVLKTLYQHNKAAKILVQHDTKSQFLQVDGGKIRKLLLAALAYAAAQQQEHCPVLLGIADTKLAYPIMSIPGYVKHVEALCMTITTESVLPKFKQWYVGSVDLPELLWPSDMEELAISYNQQMVAAHYGFAEMTTHATGVTQVYVIPRKVREVRPPTMDQWRVAPPTKVTETTMHPLEVSFVKKVHTKTHMDRKLIQQAIQLIKQYHVGVRRGKEESAYLHPIAVAHILLDYSQEQDVILAALLHDTIDATPLSLNQIALQFNPVVQRIVDGVARVDSRLKSFKRIQLSTYETIRKLLEVKDERILYVKLADRLHNMRTIEGHASLAKQKKIAEETLQFFVPIARHLKLHPIEKELQQLAAQVMSKL